MRILSTLAFITLSLYICAQDNLLVVVLMVKNEAPVICETLRPLVEGGIDNFLLFDTGSTDETIRLAKTFFAEQGVSRSIVIEEPFVNFAVSRNRALECAEEHFADIAFVLMPDAEWLLRNAQDLLTFCAEHIDDIAESYLIRIIMNSSSDFYTARLVRNHKKIRFVGVVHEVLNQISTQKVPSKIFFELNGSNYGYEKSKHRWLRDQELLKKECERNPYDARSTFYLAQTCACLDDWEGARFWYEKRVNIHGWDEENFMARYRLAQAYAELGNWDQALSHYMTAYSLRPHRAEPLIALAQYYWKAQEFTLAYLFARRAVELPYPESDILFVEKWLYEYMRYDLLGCMAWYVGAYEIGKKAVKAALAIHPDAPHLLRNLSLYEQATEAVIA